MQSGSFYCVGIDTGGTFTDFVLVSADGRVRIEKRRSTPAEPSLSTEEGLAAARASAALPAGFALVHGTTVATNALLERKGAPTALVTTAGFGDVLEIGRQERHELYRLHPSRPAPLLPAGMRYEIVERVDCTGCVLTPLSPDQVALLLDRIVQAGAESLAVCLLFAHLNDTHERAVGEIARARGLTVSLSSEIAPETREYERTNTTVANALVAPVMGRYLSRLTERAHALGAGSIAIMHSGGGTLPPSVAASQPVRTALSGPAGGVAAAAQLAGQTGVRDLITFDMGGTSTDVALVIDGQCPHGPAGEIGGLPLRVPMLAIHTIAAGGGSILRRDAGGALRVGPQSAGADPGPAAYGRGEILTLTDANVLLGRIPAAARLAGAIELDRDRVDILFARFAETLGMSPVAAALGAVSVAEAAMGRALRRVSAEQGYDPARCWLLSFGGAGGLHACGLAESVGLRGVVVPRYPGAFSALGLATAPYRREYVRGLPPHLARDGDRLATELERLLGELRTEACANAAADLVGGNEELVIEQRIDLRYAGQGFDLSVPYDGFEEAVESFHTRHCSRYGYADARQPVEAVAVRIVVERAALLPPIQLELAPGDAAPVGAAEVHFDTVCETPLYQRDELAAGQEIAGPAIVLQADATTLLPPAWRARVDEWGNLRIERSGV